MSAPCTVTGSTLTHRDRAILRAVAVGSAELVAGAEPDVYLDGLACGDQFAVHRLVRAGLIAAMGRRSRLAPRPAPLTPHGPRTFMLEPAKLQNRNEAGGQGDASSDARPLHGAGHVAGRRASSPPP